MKEEYFNLIVKILEKDFNIKNSEINIYNDFYIDFEFDSLDLVDFSLAFEKETNVVIKVKSLKNVNTIEDFLNLFI